jgi:hypothetical protein
MERENWGFRVHLNQRYSKPDIHCNEIKKRQGHVLTLPSVFIRLCQPVTASVQP